MRRKECAHALGSRLKVFQFFSRRARAAAWKNARPRQPSTHTRARAPTVKGNSILPASYWVGGAGIVPLPLRCASLSFSPRSKQMSEMKRGGYNTHEVYMRACVLPQTLGAAPKRHSSAQEGARQGPNASAPSQQQQCRRGAAGSGRQTGIGIFSPPPQTPSACSPAPRARENGKKDVCMPDEQPLSLFFSLNRSTRTHGQAARALFLEWAVRPALHRRRFISRPSHHQHTYVCAVYSNALIGVPLPVAAAMVS